MVLAHAVEVSDDDAVPVDLPAIEDGGRWVGATDLKQYVHDLQRDVAAWRKFQTDACYIDDDGGIC